MQHSPPRSFCLVSALTRSNRGVYILDVKQVRNLRSHVRGSLYKERRSRHQEAAARLAASPAL